MFLLYYSLNLSVYQFSSLNNWYRSHFVLWNLLTASLSISTMYLLTRDNNVYKYLRLIRLLKGEDNFKQQSDGRRGEKFLQEQTFIIMIDQGSILMPKYPSSSYLLHNANRCDQTRLLVMKVTELLALFLFLQRSCIVTGFFFFPSIMSSSQRLPKQTLQFMWQETVWFSSFLWLKEND